MDVSEIVAGLLDGTLSRPAPTIGRLPNGDALFYPERVNGIHGDSTAGKTWTALAVAREQIEDGEHVVYIDLEDNAPGMIGRLLEMGLDPEQITGRFHYIRPHDPYDQIVRELLLDAIREIDPTLVIIDTTGEALALQGINPNADDEVATWMRRIARTIADLGACVVLLDHIPKNTDGTTPLQPIGSQRKRAAISGAQYAQDCRDAFSVEQDGCSRLRCGKDRGGNYATGQHVADIRIGPSVDGVARLDVPAERGAFQPTHLMERVSSWLAAHPDATQNEIVAAVSGKRTGVMTALRSLVSEGYVVVESGPRHARLHTLARPYFEEEIRP